MHSTVYKMPSTVYKAEVNISQNSRRLPSGKVSLVWCLWEEFLHIVICWKCLTTGKCFPSENTSQLGSTYKLGNTSQMGKASQMGNSSPLANTSQLGNDSQQRNASKLIIMLEKRLPRCVTLHSEKLIRDWKRFPVFKTSQLGNISSLETLPRNMSHFALLFWEEFLHLNKTLLEKLMGFS